MVYYIPMLAVLVVVGIGAILYLEGRHQNAWYTNALHRWQSGIGVLLGFVSLALSVHLNALASQRADEARQSQAAKSLAAGLYVEVASLANQAAWNATSIKEVSDEVADEKKAKYPVCEDWLPAANVSWKLRSMGIFEDNKSNLGILPNELAYVLSLLEQHVSDHTRRVDEFIAAKCGKEAADAAHALFFANDIVRVRSEFIRDRIIKLGIDVPSLDKLPVI